METWTPVNRTDAQCFLLLLPSGQEAEISFPTQASCAPLWSPLLGRSGTGCQVLLGPGAEPAALGV